MKDQSQDLLRLAVGIATGPSAALAGQPRRNSKQQAVIIRDLLGHLGRVAGAYGTEICRRIGLNKPAQQTAANQAIIAMCIQLLCNAP